MAKDLSPSRKRQTAPCDPGSAATLLSKTRVVKCVRPSQPGAKKLAQRYGSALICVRYRHDPQGKLRYTTVELVVDQSKVTSRASPDEVVMVHIDFDNAPLQQLARTHGARWDGRQCLWHMTLRTARTLRLVGKIKKEQAAPESDT